MVLQVNCVCEGGCSSICTDLLYSVCPLLLPAVVCLIITSSTTNPCPALVFVHPTTSAMEQRCEAHSLVAATLKERKNKSDGKPPSGRPRGLSTRRVSGAQILAELPPDPPFVLVLSFVCSLLEQKGVTRSISMLLNYLPGGNEGSVRCCALTV